jgi:hypothetical protein
MNNLKVLVFTSAYYKRAYMMRQSILSTINQTYTNLIHSVNITLDDTAITRNLSPLYDDIIEKNNRILINYTKNYPHFGFSHFNNMKAITMVPNFDTYDIFIKMDDDDIHKSRYVENIVNIFSNNNVDIVSSKIDVQLNGYDLHDGPYDNLGGNPNNSTYHMPMTFAFNKKALNSIINLTESDVCGHDDLMWRVAWEKNNLIHLPVDNAKQIIWNIHGDNASVGYFLRKDKSLNNIEKGEDNMKIKYASYGGMDVKNIIEEYILTNKLNTIYTPNDMFTDPLPNVYKHLHVIYEINGIDYHTSCIDSSNKSLYVPDFNTLEYKYDTVCNTPSDIYEHLPTLKKYAEDCDHITEMGVRNIVSTYALLMGKPSKMISYDINNCNWHPVRDMVKDVTDFSFIIADTRECIIEDTDLLFIDTLHNYEQLKIELDRHSSKVRKYMIFHDTTTFGTKGETSEIGLWPALEEFLELNKQWAILERYHNNNGLTILHKI